MASCQRPRFKNPLVLCVRRGPKGPFINGVMSAPDSIDLPIVCMCSTGALKGPFINGVMFSALIHKEDHLYVFHGGPEGAFHKWRHVSAWPDSINRIVGCVLGGP